MDHRRFPAAAVVRLYHERWEIESPYFATGTPCSTAMCKPATGPAWNKTWACSPSTSCCAWPWSPPSRPARARPGRGQLHHRDGSRQDQLTAAMRHVCPDGPADLPGAVGRRPGHNAARPPPRFSARKVKCATSRYLNRDGSRPAHPAAITAIDIAITPPVDLKPGRTHRDRSTTPPAPPARGRPPARNGSPPSSHSQPLTLEQPRTRRPRGRQTPDHAHPARRMGTPGLLHPHRLRHHRGSTHRQPIHPEPSARPLTSRLWVARRNRDQRLTGPRSHCWPIPPKRAVPRPRRAGMPSRPASQ